MDSHPILCTLQRAAVGREKNSPFLQSLRLLARLLSMWGSPRSGEHTWGTKEVDHWG